MGTDAKKVVTMREGDLLSRWKLLALMTTDKRLSKADIAVGRVLLDLFDDRRGYAWPGRQLVAQAAHVDPRAVVRAFKRLEASGYFLVRWSRGGPGKTHRFTPRWKMIAEYRNPATVTETPPLWEGRPSAESVTVVNLAANGDKTCSATVTELPPDPTYNPTYKPTYGTQARKWGKPPTTEGRKRGFVCKGDMGTPYQAFTSVLKQDMGLSDEAAGDALQALSGQDPKGYEQMERDYAAGRLTVRAFLSRAKCTLEDNHKQQAVGA